MPLCNTPASRVPRMRQVSDTLWLILLFRTAYCRFKFTLQKYDNKCIYEIALLWHFAYHELGIK